MAATSMAVPAGSLLPANSPDMLSSDFSRLPIEMKDTVFSFIRSQQDKGQARLVCREWNTLIVPTMWKVFIYIEDSRELDISGLLHSSVLVHTSSVFLKPARPAPPWAALPTFAYNMKIILSILPSDGLEHFTFQGSIKSADLLCLLKTQGKLKMLSFASIDFSDLPPSITVQSWAATHSSWIASRLLEINKLRFFYEKPLAQSGAFDYVHFFVQNSPKLIKLWLGTMYITRRPELKPTIWRTGKLQKVDLNTVGLGNMTAARIGGEPFSELRSLRINECTEIDGFISDLATALPRNGSHLKTLEVNVTLRNKKEEIEAVETLLQSIVGLKNIKVDLNGHDHIKKDCIIRQRDTLRKLTLGSASDLELIKRYSVADVMEIVASCQLLEQLAIDIPPIQFGDMEDCDFDWSLDFDVQKHQIKSELHCMLETIAKAPNLHTLRALSYGAQDTTRDSISRHFVRNAQLVMSSYATEVLRYLIAHGSRIKVLAFSPLNSYQWIRPDGTDGNDQRWPDYHFVKCVVTDCMGRRELVAGPLKNWEVEMADSSILHG